MIFDGRYFSRGGSNLTRNSGCTTLLFRFNDFSMGPAARRSAFGSPARRAGEIPDSKKQAGLRYGCEGDDDADKSNIGMAVPSGVRGAQVVARDRPRGRVVPCDNARVGTAEATCRPRRFGRGGAECP